MRVASKSKSWIVLPGLLLVVTACGPAEFPPVLPGVTDTVIVPVSGVAPDSLTPGPHAFAPGFLAVCQQLAWTANCSDPVFTDDQRIRLENGYGSHGYIAPAPGLRDWLLTDFQPDARLIGIVWFKAEPDGPGNTGWLPAGLTCIYLQATGNGFTGFAQAASTCPAIPASTAVRLDVLAIPNPGPFGTGTELQQSAHVPPVARFHEGRTKSGSSEIVLLGFKCAARWCILSPSGSGSSPRPHAHAALNPGWRSWAIRGWSDAQRLAIGTSPGLQVSDLNASVIADTGLAAKPWIPVTNPGGFVPGVQQHAATIVLRQRPRGNYAQKWHLRQGLNELFLWRDAAGKWYGEIQNRGGSTLFRIPVYVDKKHAATNPPATARWRWNADDEEVWVACEGGCCYVSAFQ